MTGKVFTLTIRDQEVTMPLREFVYLAGELGNFGVDVEIQKDTSAGEIVFRLKDSSTTQ